MSHAMTAMTAASASDASNAGDMPGLRQLIAEDYQAAFERDPAAESLRDIRRFSVGARIVREHRINHWLWERGLKSLALHRAKRVRRKLGADIHPGATIGRRFTIDHGMGVVIGGTAVIGDDCMIYQGATLGMTGKVMSGKRHPTLGDNVMIGAGAIVLGNIHIGSDVRVGAGAVVTRDIPAHTTAVGVPAHPVAHKEAVRLRLVDSTPGVHADDTWSCAL